MAEIDLIPSEFRRTTRLRKRLKACGVGYGVLILLLLGAKLWLGLALHRERDKITTLKNEEASILQQRQSYDTLQTRRTRLEEELAILKTLRGGPKAEQMFVVIERAINGSIGISNWKFLRTGGKNLAPSPKPKTGYQMVAAAGEGKPGEQGEQEIRMEISGQALSHSALADFVNALQEERGIIEVKLQSTIEKPYLSGHAIFYEMAVRVHSSGEDGHDQSL